MSAQSKLFSGGQTLNPPESSASVDQHLAYQIENKRLQVDQLQRLAQLVAFHAGQINQATLETQSYLDKTPIKSRIDHHLKPNQCDDPLRQMEELLLMTELARKGESLKRLDSQILLLNQKTGQTRSMALEVEEEAETAKALIQKLELFVAAKEKSLREAKELALTLKSDNKE